MLSIPSIDYHTEGQILFRLKILHMLMTYLKKCMTKMIYNTNIKAVFIDDKQRHPMDYQSAGVTNINRSLLLVTCQNPHMNISLD